MKSLSLNQPHLIVMVGVPGSGKTFFAGKFAETFHAPYVAQEEIATFVSDEAAQHDLLTGQLVQLLKTHQTIIVEGFSDTRTDRLELARLARHAGYETQFIWVQTDPATAKTRVTRATKNKKGRTLSSEEYDWLAHRFVAPNAAERPVVISGKHTYATQAKVVLKKLSAPRAEISVHPTAPVARTTQSGRRNITIR